MAPVVALKPALRALAACGVLALAAGLFAYENDGTARSVKGGPHRAINRLALLRFFEESKADPVVSRYDLARSRTLLDETYVSGGMFRPGTGDRSATFTRWIEEGGYTADEPELYASFRHFYDPLALNSEMDAPLTEQLVDAVLPALANPRVGVPYLTDDLNSLNRVHVTIAGTTVNPRIHAREWAIDGPANNGSSGNPYCWKKGVEYVEKAFSATGPEKQRLWAKAWRSLGETMHLLGDMTSVPHVRNDSHPSASTYLGAASNDVGRLRSDPYEALAQEALVVVSAGGAPPAVPLGETPEALFDAVAGFTNASFFSADTIAGTDPVSGEEVTNANGMRPYPSPRLEECREENGYLVKEVAGRTVRMAHRSWLASAGWGAAKGHVRLSSACVRDQASILVPLAVAANVKLVDLFLPRVRVEVTDVDLTTKKLRGRVVHVPYGALTKELKYSSGPGELSTVRLDDGPQDFERYRVEIRDGVVEADLSGLDLRKGQRLRLDVEVGGIVVKSGEFVLGDDLLARLQRTTRVGIALEASGDERVVVKSGSFPAAGDRVESGSYKGFRYFSSEVPGAGQAPSFVPLVWSGPSFTAERRIDVTPGCLRCSREGRTHRGTVFLSISGTVDVGARTLASLRVSYRRETSYPPECGLAKIAARFGLTDRDFYEEEASVTGLPIVLTGPATSEAPVTFGVEGPGTASHVTAVRMKWAGARTELVGAEAGTQRNELVRVDWQSAAPRPSLQVYFQR